MYPSFLLLIDQNCTKGYGCEDHFLEMDTFRHSWEVLLEIIERVGSEDILLDVGMPVLHRDVAYNCRVLVFHRRILLIRPKMVLADDGNYRESRWFRPWPRSRSLEHHQLPMFISRRTGQRTCPIGEAILVSRDGVRIASETCEELFTLDAPHINYYLNGVDIVANGSGSHHNLRKLHQRVDLLRSASGKGGGVYLYANQLGCDGGRLYYDGSALICVNGNVVAQGEQFSIEHEVEVVSALIDLDEIRAFRSRMTSRGLQASQMETIPEIEMDFCLLMNDVEARTVNPTEAIHVRYYLPEQEIALGPACWLWDYLRRSGMAGFFLPLSGGADSSATATIVGSMCQLVSLAARNGNVRVVNEARRIAGRDDLDLSDPKNLAHEIFHSCYMGSKGASSEGTRLRAKHLAESVGSYHLNIDIGGPVDACIDLFAHTFQDHRPRFRVHGGSNTENLALQNIQARIRMVLSYLFAQLMPCARSRSGSLLVLGSANVDEGLRGYLTKYDCSSADINPIGGISKADLKRFLKWASNASTMDSPSLTGLGYSCLMEILEAPPSAELEPIEGGYVQTDEADMGMTYAELTSFGRLRKLHLAGPVSMFQKLCILWRENLSPAQVAEKVKFFFRMYSINRHKMTTLTPSYHAENYSPEDNRFDLRQFLYNSRWPWQFRIIDEEVREGSSNETHGLVHALD